jgi:hypothetical protein
MTSSGKAIPTMGSDSLRLASLSVRRWGEDEGTPIVLDNRRACGTLSDHYTRGCIGLRIEGPGMTQLVHLTTDEALRLSDLLRAMAATDPDVAVRIERGGDDG